MALVTKYGLLALGLMAFSSSALANWWPYVGAGASYMHHRQRGIDIEENKVRPTLQLGVMREINQDWSMGTGVDVLVKDIASWGNSGNLLMWRVANFEYQINPNWAINGYGGAARYYRETSAWGYGLGGGVQYYLNDQLSIAADVNWTDTDTSDNWNTELTHNKDLFVWGTVALRYRF